MSQNFRLDKAGYINRAKKISFKFNRKKNDENIIEGSFEDNKQNDNNKKTLK